MTYTRGTADSFGSAVERFLLLAKCFESYQLGHRRTDCHGSFHSTWYSRRSFHKLIDIIMHTTATPPLNLLRTAQVCSKLKISKTTLYCKLDKNSKYYDPNFPRQIKLGASSVGWVEHQIDQWIIEKLHKPGI